MMIVKNKVVSRCLSPCMLESLKLRHHQPINIPTAGAQAFLMDYT
jgi:hypothetical protein